MKSVYVSDPKGRKFLSAAAFILTVLILIGLNILRQYLSDKFPEYMPDIDIRQQLPERIVTWVMIILAAGYVVFIVILLPMWYKTLRYTVTEKNITAEEGLFSKTSRIMKLSSVQHISRISMPLSGKTGFNFISVNALGGRILMMFLSEEDCSELTERFGQLLTGKSFHPAEEKSAPGSYINTDKDICDGNSINSITEDIRDYIQLSFADIQNEAGNTDADNMNGKDQLP